MKVNIILSIIIGILSIISVTSKSQDYGRHIELSLLFYECQRSGPLPKNNRIYWRHDSMVDAGKDNGVDLTGGYYDAGDNVKFNFPQAASMTLLAWSGIEFADGYKKADQWKYLLDAVKWGTDYFIKCHTAKTELYVQVGDGQVDHAWWYPPEYIDYKYPSMKIDAANPGSEVAAETAASLAAASMLFKDEDSAYSATLLQHAKEIYDFADKYRGDYVKAVPNAQGFYNIYSGFLDELAWGAVWLYYATGDEYYHDKYKEIADAEYSEYDPKKFIHADGPISWDDKRPGCYILIALITGEEKRMKDAYEYCDLIISQPRTGGGLWYNTNLSKWASNRYAANAASMLAIFANILPESDPKRKEYIDFVKSQIDYILGDNPAGVNYVVGAEENSPKAVHHRGASGACAASACGPDLNIYTLYGALAGGPGSGDTYIDDRGNYEMNEVALDYNAGFTLCLASLLHFGFGTKDGPVDFDRSWPQKAMASDISVSVSSGNVKISTGSGLLCSGWCVYIKGCKAKGGNGGKTVNIDDSTFAICNTRGNGFLDGKGTPQTASFSTEGECSPPNEFEVMCDGYNSLGPGGDPSFKPEFGLHYKVTSPGGPGKTVPMFEESKCWPSFIC